MDRFDSKNGIRKKILIVDDELIEREMLGAMLDGTYEVLSAENGAVALDMLRTEGQAISIVLLDLHMPVMNGYELLKVIRADSELRRIPVIVLTAEKGSEVECLQMGAADFITKPYELPEIIMARVSRSIELAENSVIIHETEKDELTGLFNKEFFFEYGKMTDQRTERPMDAVVLDVNRFHILNELYGREYGDTVLRKIAAAIHTLVQADGGLACRADSNCFYLYVPGGEDIRSALDGQIRQINKDVGGNNLSIRIGVYTDDGSGIEMERKFDRARLACSKLRESYGTCFGFYNDDMQQKEIYAERLIADMDRALAEKQFKVYYQPKYNIRGQTPVLASAEALICWTHPEFGLLSPGVFISLFENHGMIYQLDKYVWNEAAAQIAAWRDAYGVTLPVSVNVSRVDVFNPMLARELDGIIEKNGIQRDQLLLEITESAYTYNAGKIVETLHGLKASGFKIEMDDFGSGYSSLNMLTTMPIDALKLDMSFIKTICTDPKTKRLVGIMIEIARLMDVPVIAEGVETREQLEILKSMGCDVIQGYYFSKPLPPDEFEKLFEKTI